MNIQHPPGTPPGKEAVPQHLERRRTDNAPPPAPERIRQELGWWLIPANRA